MYKDLHVDDSFEEDFQTGERTYIITNVNKEIIAKVVFDEGEGDLVEQRKIAEQVGAKIMGGIPLS